MGEDTLSTQERSNLNRTQQSSVFLNELSCINRHEVTWGGLDAFDYLRRTWNEYDDMVDVLDYVQDLKDYKTMDVIKEQGEHFRHIPVELTISDLDVILTKGAAKIRKKVKNYTDDYSVSDVASAAITRSRLFDDAYFMWSRLSFLSSEELRALGVNVSAEDVEYAYISLIKKYIYANDITYYHDKYYKKYNILLRNHVIDCVREHCSNLLNSLYIRTSLLSVQHKNLPEYEDFVTAIFTKVFTGDDGTLDDESLKYALSFDNQKK